MRKNKNISKIILATISAILAATISYSTFNNIQGELSEKQKLIDLMQKTKASQNTSNYAYAVAKTNLKAGEIVSDEDVDFQNFESQNNIAFDNRSDIVNKVLLQDIDSGGIFTSDHIAKISNDSTELKEGCRALTLPLDNFQGKSDKMAVGSYVDIYSTSGDSDWILERIKILGFEGDKKDSSGKPINTIMDSNSVNFEVAVGDIPDFISSISKSKLVLVARDPNDKSTKPKKMSSVLGGYDAAPPISSLPNLPEGIPNLSGLPQPLNPDSQPASVELIEANVKSKVTFE